MNGQLFTVIWGRIYNGDFMKKHPIMILLILCSVFSGCISNNSDNGEIPLAEFNDLSLSINMDKLKISMNDSLISVRISLTNIGNNSVKVIKAFDFSNTLNYQLKYNKSALIPLKIEAQHKNSYIILKKGESLDYTINIKEINLFYDYKYNNQFVWQFGKYIIQFEYSFDPMIYSNKVEFEITT